MSAMVALMKRFRQEYWWIKSSPLAMPEVRVPLAIRLSAAIVEPVLAERMPPLMTVSVRPPRLTLPTVLLPVTSRLKRMELTSRSAPSDPR